MSYQETTAQHNQNHKSPSHANGPNNPPQKQATRIFTSYRRETATRASLVDLPSGSKPSSGFSGGVEVHLTAIPRRPLVLLSPPTGSLTTVDPVRSGVKTGSSPRPRAEPASGPSSRTTGTVSDGPLQVSTAVRQPGGHYPRRPGRANRTVLRRRDRPAERPAERPPKTAVPLTSDRTEPIGRTRAPRRRLGRAPPVLGRNRTVPHVERPRRHPAARGAPPERAAPGAAAHERAAPPRPDERPGWRPGPDEHDCPLPAARDERCATGPPRPEAALRNPGGTIRSTTGPDEHGHPRQHP